MWVHAQGLGGGKGKDQEFPGTFSCQGASTGSVGGCYFRQHSRPHTENSLFQMVWMLEALSWLSGLLDLVVLVLRAKEGF